MFNSNYMSYLRTKNISQMDLQSIVRYLCGDMDEAEKKKVTDWISENEQNKGDFDKFSKI